MWKFLMKYHFEEVKVIFLMAFFLKNIVSLIVKKYTLNTSYLENLMLSMIMMILKLP